MVARRAIGDSGQAQRCIKTLHGRGYRFIADVTVVGQPRDHLARPHPRRRSCVLLGPFSLCGRQACVAREAEFAVLRQSLTMALQGQRQVVFLTGEAGIGKTTLVDAFVTDMAPATAWWVGRGQCIDQYGAGEAYLPPGSPGAVVSGRGGSPARRAVAPAGTALAPADARLPVPDGVRRPATSLLWHNAGPDATGTRGGARNADGTASPHLGLGRPALE